MGEKKENDQPDETLTRLATLFSLQSIVTSPIIMGWLGVISFVMGAVGLYFTFIYNKEAKPVYKTLYNIILTEGIPNSKIRVFYDSAQVENVRAATIAIWNSGNDYLDKSRISKGEPITIACDKAVSILEASVLKTSRTNLFIQPTVYVDDMAGTPSDTLADIYDNVVLTINGDDGLEAGDGCLVKIIYTTQANTPQWHVKARIKGMTAGFSKISAEDSKFDNGQNRKALYVDLFVVTLFCIFFSTLSLGLNRLEHMYTIPGFVVINRLFSYGLFFFPLYLLYKLVVVPAVPNDLLP